jgi:putative transposase
MPKLRHFDHLGTARFVTFSCYRRRPLLEDMNARKIIIAELARLRQDRNIKLIAYVIMPEHMHLVVLPPEGLKLGPAIGIFKTRTAHAILDFWRSDQQQRGRIVKRESGDAAVWQRRCYDHNCRTPDTVLEKVRYCHNNPVTRRLVERPEDWPWSSCRWYLGHREGVLEIDGIEILTGCEG